MRSSAVRSHVLDFTDVAVKLLAGDRQLHAAELVAEPQPSLPDFAKLIGRFRVSDGYAVFTGALIFP